MFETKKGIGSKDIRDHSGPLLYAHTWHNSQNYISWFPWGPQFWLLQNISLWKEKSSSVELQLCRGLDLHAYFNQSIQTPSWRNRAKKISLQEQTPLPQSSASCF